MKLSETMQTIIELQNTAQTKGLRLTGIAVDPDILETLDSDVKELQKVPLVEQPIELHGISITPYYPESTRLKARMSQVNLINSFGAYLRQHACNVNKSEGVLEIGEFQRSVYGFLGVDMDALKAEQENIRSRIADKNKDTENTTEEK